MARRAFTVRGAHGLSLCAVLAALACASPGSPGDPEAARPPGVDTPVSGGKTIGVKGGSVSVGPLTLEFPEGALLEPARITLTPLLSQGALPRDPPALTPVRAEPQAILFRKPVRVSFASTADVSRLVVAQLLPSGQGDTLWWPLSSQKNSPGLAWGFSESLGTFALVPARCCLSSDVERPCTLRCEVGPLLYKCDGEIGSRECCDPYGRIPVYSKEPSCP